MRNLVDTLHTTLVFGRRVRTLAAALASMVPPGSEVLDVGCGDGQISAQLTKNGSGISVRGIDVLLRPNSHIPVTQFEGNKIPFPDASFDLVMFVDVLHHTQDPAAQNYYEWCGDHNKPLEAHPFGNVGNGGPMTLPDPKSMK